MRLLVMVVCCAVVLTGLGCYKRVPAKKPPAAPAPPKVPTLNVRSLGTPSPLIDSPADPGGDKLPFDLPLNKGYGIDGGWRGPNQVKGTTQFERIGDFTVKKADNADVDPREIAEMLRKWIASSGVAATQSSGGDLQGTISYATSQSWGTISWSIRPDAPAKDVTFHLEVREQPRQSR
jgi:hypothetical protein